MRAESGTLYIVATPIGNLEDMTYRAVRVLSEVNMVAAEDTRHSRLLLNHFNINTPLYSCHKFNEAEKSEMFINALHEGKDVALISDAGTPCISDPGYRLVSLAAAEGVTVVPVCGANAVAAALSVSGFDAAAFHFLGFLPRTEKRRAEALKIVEIGEPVVFYESPKRIISAVSTLADNFPEVSLCLCNDITKKFERIYRGTPAEVAAELSGNPNFEKGEYACVVCGVSGKAAGADKEELSVEAQLVDLMVKDGITLKEAVKKMSGKNKNAAYAASLRLKGMLTV